MDQADRGIQTDQDSSRDVQRMSAVTEPIA